MRLKWTSLLPALLLSASLLAVATQDKDWIKATTKDGAITFTVPPGYIVDDPNDPAAKARMEKVIQDNPKLAKMMTPGAKNDQTLQMYDLNDSLDDGALDTFNVISQPNPGLKNEHLKDVGKQVVGSLPLVGKGEYKVVDMPFGKALHYWGTVSIKVPEGDTRKMDLAGYLFFKGNKMHVVSFATGEGQYKEKRVLFEKIIKTAKL